MRLPESEAIAFIQRVEAGEIQLELIGGSFHYFDSIVQYTTACGWTLGVFNDVGEWDYLEWITSPDGREWTYENACINGDESPLQAYQPTDEIAHRVYHWGLMITGR